MKNQYFGDINDFFKYDLVFNLIEKIENLKCFTFIPMLTEDDGSSDGGLTIYDGSRRKELDDFLKDCIKKSDRRVKNLRSFMSKYEQIEYHPYKDDEYFLHAEREQYFDSIHSSILNESVILIDPDNGFEVKSMRSGTGHKYIKYKELSTIYTRMDSSSLIIVYQHIPRVKKERFFARVGEKICNCKNTKNLIYLSDNRIVFFIMAKTDELKDKTREVLDNYSNINKKIYMKVLK